MGALANAKVGERNLQRMNVLEQPQPMKNSFEMGMQEHSSVWPGLVTPACNPIHPVRQKLHRFKGRLNKFEILPPNESQKGQGIA